MGNVGSVDYNLYMVGSLKVKGDKIVDVDKDFLLLTGYKKSDFIYRNIQEISQVLRIKAEYNLMDNQNQDIILFTKSLTAKELKLIVKPGDSPSEKEYIFYQKSHFSIYNNAPFLEQLYEANIVGVAIFAVPDIVVLDANQTYLNFLDRPYNERENTIGRKLEDIISGWKGSSSEEIWEDVLSTGEGYHIDEYMYEFERGITYWNATLTPIYEGLRMKYVVETTMDITDRVLSRNQIMEQARLIQQQKLELEKNIQMKEEFLATISHEFKTPLAVIDAAVQAFLLLYGQEMPSKAKYLIDKIHQNSLRQQRLVNNLLDITRYNTGKTKVWNSYLDIVQLTECIIESVEIYGKQKGVELIFVSDVKEKIIPMDEEKYERILLNLLSNAIKFTPSGKRILVKIWEVNQNICLEVKDEGIGIPKDKQDMIFERFGQVDNTMTRQTEGTGIGLSLVKALVSTLRGRVSVCSEVGQGSTFLVEIPIHISVEQENHPILESTIDDRIVHAVKVEFSDIYL